MKKILVILLALVALFSFAACATTTITYETPTKEPANETEAGEETAKDVLSFIEKDEIYFDIHLSQGYFDKTSVKVGETTLTESGKAAYTGSEDIVFEGTSDKDDDVYVVIVALKVGEKAAVDYTVAEASSLALQLQTRIPIHKANRDKVLVIITDTKGDYDKNLNEAIGEIVAKSLSE